MSIEVRNVSKRFGDFQALDDVSLEVASGSLTALLGPCGSGKSTLLRIIAGLERPDSGAIRLAGEDATALPPQKRGVGFVFQHYAAFKHMTVRENIAFGLKIRKRPKDEIAARVDELLDLVQLQGFGDRYPAQLSGGQRQRMALARALAPEPKVLLLDEPFGALDARVRAELRVWLRRLHDETHTTTVFVTHDQEEAMEVADSVVVMNKRPRRAGRRRRGSSTTRRRTSSSCRSSARRTASATRWVRPHDLEADARSRTARRARRWSSASCTSASKCGPSSSSDDGEPFAVQLTRDQAEELELERGPDRLRRARTTRRRVRLGARRSSSVRRPGVRVGGERRDRAGSSPRGEVGERHLLEHAAQARPDCDPHVAQPFRATSY